ncbi:MAG: hypothetical protein KC609_22755, partial [Myxococcales bacterium]|nr:hypothetical protein [Myxococcales bacterium]
RGWYVQPQLSFGGYPACMHLTVMSGTQVAIVDEFLGDLKTSIAAAKALPDASPAPSLVQLLQSLDPATLNSQTIAQLLGMAGIRGTDLPKRMAEINGLIDAMPPRLSEAILADFVNQMFVCPSEV